MIVKETLLKKENKYVVGVSGGCDSMALLHFLKNHDYQIVVCHVNYHYRYDSDEDQQLVVTYCKEHDIPCFIKEIQKHDTNQNFQTQARKIRYLFYQKIVKQYDCKGVILGHHLDDVLETIYMQKDRGMVEYLGIKECSLVQGMLVIRPLLDNGKQDILNYCNEHGVIYHDDYTNFETNFRRDYIRNKILCYFSKQEKEELLKEADKYNKWMEEQEKRMQPWYQAYAKEGMIDSSKLDDTSLRWMIYYMLKQDIYPPLISQSLIDEILKQVRSNKPNIEMPLPVNHLFIKEYHNIYVLSNKKKVSYCINYDHLVYDKQEYFTLSDKGHINEGIYLKESDFPITVRSFLPGDHIQTSGGRKKVARLFVDAKIPKQKREVWPILQRKDGTILLVPNLAKNINYLSTKPNVFVIK